MFPLKLYYENQKVHYKGFTKNKRIANQFKYVVDELGIFLPHFFGTVYEYDRNGSLIGKTFINKGKLIPSKRINYDFDKNFEYINFVYTGEIDNFGDWSGFGRYSFFDPTMPNQKITDEKIIYCGYFLEGKRNGFGVLFNNFDGDEFFKVYNGNWKNGKPHGEGIVYYPNGSTFLKGTWNRGKCTGSCLIFNQQNDLVYNGSWDEYHGQAIFYDFHSGILQYEGLVQNGLPNGIGGFKNYPRSSHMDVLCMESFNDYSQRYFGDIKNGIPHGFGKTRRKFKGTVIVSIGNFDHGVMKGPGIQWKSESFETSCYVGNFQNDDSKDILQGFFPTGCGYGVFFKGASKLGKMFQSIGLDTWKNEVFGSKTIEGVEKNVFDRITNSNTPFRLFFKGIFKYFQHVINLPISYHESCNFVQGKTYYKNQVVQYEGDFLEEEFHGKGKLFYPSGELCYEGEWKNDRQVGQGTFHDHDIEIPNTIHKNGSCSGYGVYMRKYDDKILYRGYLKNGLPDGEGLIYEYDWSDNIEFVFTGTFFQGKYYWEKTMYNMDHQIVFEGACDTDGRYINGTEIVTDENDNEIEIKWLNGKIFDEECHRGKSKEQLLLNTLVETQNYNCLSKISKNTCILMHRKMVNNRRSYRNCSKLGIVKEIIARKKQNQYNEDHPLKEDLYGNEIVDPVIGTDGQTYDMKSMQTLFNINDEDEYSIIPYGYSEENEKIPLFPNTGHHHRLDGFYIESNVEKLIYRKVKVVDGHYIYLC